VVEVFSAGFADALAVLRLGKGLCAARYKRLELEGRLVVVVLAGNQTDVRVELAVVLHAVTVFVFVNEVPQNCNSLEVRQELLDLTAQPRAISTTQSLRVLVSGQQVQCLEFQRLCRLHQFEQLPH